MIRNIVFDLGNVLISFRPAAFIKKNYPDALGEQILKDIFNSREWSLLDKGSITIQEAIESIARKSSLKKEEIALIFNKRTEIMFPLNDNIRLLPELKKEGFRLFYLSNFPIDIFDEVKNEYSFFRYFDGGLISSEIKSSKPDLEIYRIFLQRFKLNPKETLYIDDIEVNIKTAEFLGMKILFTEGSSNFYNVLFSRLNHK